MRTPTWEEVIQIVADHIETFNKPSDWLDFDIEAFCRSRNICGADTRSIRCYYDRYLEEELKPHWKKMGNNDFPDELFTL